jgi:proprotein convertase subtilisin/kexin type 5
VKDCPLGYYQKDGVCVSCVKDCVSCTSEQQCTKCVDTLVLVNGKCSSMTCPSGQYKCDNFCDNCHKSCATCSGPEKDDCLSCPKGLVLGLDRTCIDSCLPG